jgi:SAM-dependent methyltransferase
MVKKIFKKLWQKITAFFSGFWWYTRDLFKYKALLSRQGAAVKFYYFPQIFDHDASTHTFDKHYVYMDRWAFKNIMTNKPKEHTDVGSSIRFLSMASAITQVQFVDIRPVKLDFDNFKCIEGSILDLPFSSDSLNSLSCLHVAEHIGLGRYGDPLDPEGTKKACMELRRVLAKGGHLYFALPIGKPAVYFNAHRVHSPKVILEYFKGLSLADFSAINDAGHFIPEAKMENFEGANYSCGCFHFIKI